MAEEYDQWDPPGREEGERWMAAQKVALERVAGGPELIAALGFVPSFHDAYVVRLGLNTYAASELVLLVDPQPMVLVRKVNYVITFRIGEIAEMQLQDFLCGLNVLFELQLRWVRPREPYREVPDSAPDDLETVLGGSVGLSGTLRCRDVAITLEPQEVV